MPRLRNALTVVAAGVVLSLAGAGTALAAPAGHCPPPPDDECSSECGGGMHGGIHLDGLLDGLLGGLLGHGGGCCEPDHD